MAKLTLALAPTFPATVQIPVPGKKPSPVEFTFKARTRDEFRAFLEGLAALEDADAVMAVASGWNLDEPFGRENVEVMIQNYIGSAKAVLDKYLSELTNARLGN